MNSKAITVTGDLESGYSFDCPHCDEMNVLDGEEMIQIRQRENVVTCERCNHEFTFKIQ